MHIVHEKYQIYRDKKCLAEKFKMCAKRRNHESKANDEWGIKFSLFFFSRKIASAS